MCEANHASGVEFIHKLRRVGRRQRPEDDGGRSNFRAPPQPAAAAAAGSAGAMSLKRIIADTMAEHAAKSSKPTAMAMAKLQDLEVQAAANRLEVSAIKQRVASMLTSFDRRAEAEEVEASQRETGAEVRSRMDSLMDEYSATCDDRGATLAELNRFFARTKKTSGGLRSLPAGLGGGGGGLGAETDGDGTDDSAMLSALASVEAAKGKLQAREEAPRPHILPSL